MRTDLPPPIEPEVTSGEDRTIFLYGTGWCGDCHRTRRFLDRNHVAYQWIDADSDPHAYDVIRAINRGRRSVPTLVFPDGTVMTEPSDRALSQKLGITPTLQVPHPIDVTPKAER